jgi:hypothetical protein
MLESYCSVIVVVNVIILVCDVGGVTDVALDDVNELLVVSVTSDDGVGTCVNEVGVTSVVAVDGGIWVIVVLTPDVVTDVNTKTVEEVAVVTDTGVTIVGVVVRI